MASALNRNFCTVAEAAEIIGVHHSQVTRYIKADLLPAERIGNQLFVVRREAERFERPGQGFRKDLANVQNS